MDAEDERQGEILAFYGEEETRNYDSPEPGPVVEKDDVTTKETKASVQVGQKLSTESFISGRYEHLFHSVLFGAVIDMLLLKRVFSDGLHMYHITISTNKAIACLLCIHDEITK